MDGNKEGLPNHITEANGWVKPIQNIDGDIYASGRAKERQDRQDAMKAKKSETRRKRIAIGAAGFAAAAAIGVGMAEKAVNQTQTLSDERNTPERTATQNPAAQNETNLNLTPDQFVEKAKLDDEIRKEENDLAAEASKNQPVPETVKNQNFEGLETDKLE